MTALTAYAGKELLSGPLKRRIQNKAKEDYLRNYRKKKNDNENNDNSDNEKTAGIKDEVKDWAKRYVRKYGESNLENIIKPVASTIATMPLIYGAEMLKQKRITKQIEKRNAEKAKQNQERGEDNNGRDYKGGKREYNS